MTTNVDNPRDDDNRLPSQIEVMRSEFGDNESLGGGIEVTGGRQDGNRSGIDYIARRRTVLVRDRDLPLLQGGGAGAAAAGTDALLPGRPDPTWDGNANGLTRYIYDSGESVEQVCARLDRELGRGIVTPDHLMFVVPATSSCPATEPESVSPHAVPYPSGSCAQHDGRGIQVAILDSGMLADAVATLPWLAGVTGDPEDPYFAGNPPERIRSYAGHGTFSAGALRSVAAGADVALPMTFRKNTNGVQQKSGVFESDLVAQVSRALGMGADILSLSFGTNTRSDIAPLGFEVIARELQSYKGVVVVAAAGNDGDRRPFWPAALPWTVSVGALDLSWTNRASFSNYGGWVDVFAPGEGLVNAYATGTFECVEPPNTGQVRPFKGMARWSGTSFATPIVAGLIAARMSVTGQNGKAAAADLIAEAQGRAIPGVGAVLLPGHGCPAGAHS